MIGDGDPEPFGRTAGSQMPGAVAQVSGKPEVSVLRKSHERLLQKADRRARPIA